MGKKIMKVVFQVFGVFLFISISSYALLAAYGYQIDVLKQNIVKTSIIDLSNPLDEVKVYFNDTLVAEKTPFQIKNIEPGEHTVKISKQGFLPWQKKVKVELNVVSKINDILLLPEKFEIYGKNFDLGFDYDSVINNNQWILFISYKNNKIHAYKLNENGSFLIDSLNIKLNKNYNFSFAGDDNLVYQDKNMLTMLNLSDKSIMNVAVPDEFENFRLAFSPSLKGFYINGGNLYSADIDDDGAFKEIILLSEDKVFKTEGFEIENFINRNLILTDSSLYLYDGSAVKLLDKDVSGNPEFYSNGNELLFIKNWHEIIRYNIVDSSEYFIGRLGQKVDQVAWFADNNHLLIKTGKELSVCDFTFTNCRQILNITDDDMIIPGLKETQFVMISKNQIVSYTYKVPN